MTDHGAHSSEKAGLAPGTLLHVGKARTEAVTISVIDYDAQTVESKTFTTAKKTGAYKETPTVTWLNVEGVHEPRLVEQIGEQYDIHPLTLEDIVNTQQRPKIEDYGHYVYVVVRMLRYDERARRIAEQQVSFILGKNFVISFLEVPGDVFDPVRDRIRTAKGRVRSMGADYLAYALIDAVVDGYFAVLDKLDEWVGSLEERLLADPPPETPRLIQEYKREMNGIRKAVWPLRDVTRELSRGGMNLVGEATAVYFRDVHDHTNRFVDAVEFVRDTLSSMHDLYLSSMNNRMNEVMKVLTIIATIFIPLGFVAGVYGMNFQHMLPAQEHPWSFYLVLGVMSLVGSAMLVYFRKKKWL